MMMVMSCWTDLPKLEGISNPFLSNEAIIAELSPSFKKIKKEHV
jgi:hypothetical protein